MCTDKQFMDGHCFNLIAFYLYSSLCVALIWMDYVTFKDHYIDSVIHSACSLFYRPILVAGTGNQGVCISLAYCPNSDNIVATFRPKVDVPDETVISQLSQAPSLNLGHHVQGSHVLVKRLGSSYQTLGSTSANVPGIRLPKSTIVELDDSNSAFACGDEATSNLVLQGLPSLTFTQSLQSYHPIRDVRYAASQKPGVICCLGQDRMQFFSQKYL